MMIPVMNGWTENTIRLNQQHVEMGALSERIRKLEIVFGNGQGENFIYDSLMSKITDEVSRRMAGVDCEVMSVL